MATATGLGYADAGVVIAASMIAATAATVGLRAQQASEAPAPTTIQSALVTSSAAPTNPASGSQPSTEETFAAPTTTTAAPSIEAFAAQFAAPARTPQGDAAPSTLRRHHEDDDEREEHESHEASLFSLFGSTRREHQ